jgi:Ca2+-binding EF-hand superfamily protein
VDKEGAEESKEIMTAIFKRVDKDGDGSITIGYIQLGSKILSLLVKIYMYITLQH